MTKLPTLPMSSQDPNTYMIMNTVIPAKLKVSAHKYHASGSAHIDTPSFQSLAFDQGKKGVIKRIKDYRDDNITNLANTENT